MPARPARRTAALVAGLVLAASFAGALAAGAAPRAKPAITSIAAPAPHDAASDPQLRLTDISCPAAGDCWAVGTYDAKGGAHRGVLEHLVDGKWQARTAPEPVFADTDPKVTLTVLACPATDFCVAVGTYRDATDAPRTQALIETYERATPHATPTWSGGPMLAPHRALAQIADASCSSEQSCATVGSYVHGGVRRALLETYDGAGWLATDAPLPPYADAGTASSLGAVDCAADDGCSAVGSYTTTSGAYAGLLERRLTTSSWTDELAPPPDNAKPKPGVRLRAIDCPDIDTCLAGGRYTTATAHERGLVEARVLGSWSPTAAPLPADSAVDPGMMLTALSCAAADTCAATSELTDAHGHQVGALLTLAGGHWHAVVAPLRHAAASPHVQLTDLACGQVAVGTFTDEDGHTRPLLETLGSTGTWTGRLGPLPASAGRGAASPAAVACDPGGRAIAVGRYVDSNGRHRGMIIRDVPA